MRLLTASLVFLVGVIPAAAAESLQSVRIPAVGDFRAGIDAAGVPRGRRGRGAPAGYDVRRSGG
jgi:hypothetical protein